MHDIVASHPGLQRKHRQNRQRGETHSRIAQRRPCQYSQDDEGGQRQVETIHFKSLVHREGFEPSYLRGGADLQSAGFNHSPTCAELQNSSALPAHPAFLEDIHRYGRSLQTDSSIQNHRKDEEQKCARICPRTQTPHLENSLMECRWENLSSRRAASCPRVSCLPEPMLELAKGFEPLTL
jgi:hypothetical protein